MSTIVVSKAESGRPVLEILKRRLNLSWFEAKRLISQRCVSLGHAPCVDPSRKLKQGQRVVIQEAKKQSRRIDQSSPVIRYVDAHIVVVEKPAGLTTMRHAEEAAEFGPKARKFLPPTLADLLSAKLAGMAKIKNSRVRAVHRLDKDTSGLVVFVLTAEAERNLGLQFRAHSLERKYLALVRGRAKPGRIESYLVDDRGDGRRGSAKSPGEGKRAVTHVKVLEDLGNFTLIECRLETGRTHQVRIHLGERGTPLCGERIYDRPIHGQPVPDQSGAHRMALHAATLGFVHPATQKVMKWESQLPDDMQRVLTQLRKKR